MTESTLRDVVEAHKELVRETGKGLMSRDGEAVTRSLVGLALGLASSSPALGALGSDLVGQLFANTATRRLQKAMADAEGEEAKRAFIRDISAAIEALLGEFLLQIVRVQHNVKDELVSRLGGRPELSDFASEVAKDLRAYAVRVDLIEVSEGGLGVEVSPAGRSAFIKTITVRGPGATGLKV